MINHNFLLAHPGKELRVNPPKDDDELSASVQLDGELAVELKAEPDTEGMRLIIFIHSAWVEGRRGRIKNPPGRRWLEIPRRDITPFAAADLIDTLSKEIAARVTDKGETFDKAVHHACKEIQNLPAVEANLAEAAA